MQVSTIQQAHEQVAATIDRERFHGTPAAHQMWFEDAEGFLFGVSAIELLRDHDMRYSMFPGRTMCVRKADGDVYGVHFFPGNSIDARLKAAVKHDGGQPTLL